MLCDVFNPDIWERLDYIDNGWNFPLHEALAKMGLKILVTEGAVKFKLLKAATHHPVWMELLYMLNDGMDAIKQEDVLSESLGGGAWSPVKFRKWTFNELADLIEEHIINKYS